MFARHDPRVVVAGTKSSRRSPRRDHPLSVSEVETRVAPVQSPAWTQRGFDSLGGPMGDKYTINFVIDGLDATLDGSFHTETDARSVAAGLEAAGADVAYVVHPDTEDA